MLSFVQKNRGSLPDRIVEVVGNHELTMRQILLNLQAKYWDMFLFGSLVLPATLFEMETSGKLASRFLPGAYPRQRVYFKKADPG